MEIIRRRHWSIQRTIALTLAWALAWSLAWIARAQDATPVDTIYFNGRIVTVNQN